MGRWLIRHVPRLLARRAFDLLLAVLCVLSGGIQLLGAPPPPSITRGLPDVVRIGWSVALLCGGLLVVVGLVGRAVPRPLPTEVILTHLERAGLMAMAVAAAVYAVVITAASAPSLASAMLPLGTFIVFAFACWLRAADLAEDLRQLIAPIVPPVDVRGPDPGAGHG